MKNHSELKKRASKTSAYVIPNDTKKVPKGHQKNNVTQPIQAPTYFDEKKGYIKVLKGSSTVVTEDYKGNQQTELIKLSTFRNRINYEKKGPVMVFKDTAAVVPEDYKGNEPTELINRAAWKSRKYRAALKNKSDVLSYREKIISEQPTNILGKRTMDYNDIPPLEEPNYKIRIKQNEDPQKIPFSIFSEQTAQIQCFEGLTGDHSQIAHVYPINNASPLANSFFEFFQPLNDSNLREGGIQETPESPSRFLNLGKTIDS